MTYQALYRQWRPQTFSEFVGQEHVAKTLQNAIEQGRLAHAYLFCGSRGTGKTSAAKILAKAVNCQNGPSPEPCNQCPACRGIQSGRVMDVLEIDAASNRGIDEIRDLREKARYAPVEVRRKVYIIDEVHMLTAEAFNALLKTLEEPPGHVLFILATTEPHKLPATIISRCQRLDFRLIAFDVLKERLSKVVLAAGRECEEAAINLVAEEAAGSLRDGLSLLEQVLAYTTDVVTAADVLAVLGAVGRDVYYELTDAILKKDLSKALLLLQKIAVAGKDFHHFTQQAIIYFRDLMVVLSCGDNAQKLGIASDWAGRLYQQAKSLGLSEIGRILSLLHELLGEVRWSNRPRLLWELAIFNMFSFTGYIDAAEEESFVSETPALPLQKTEYVKPQERVPQPASSRQPPGSGMQASGTNTQQKFERVWPKILEEVKKESVKTHALLLSGETNSFDGKVLELCFAAQFHCDMMESEQNKQPLIKVLQRLFGEEIRIRCIVQGTTKQEENNKKDPDELIHSAVEIFRGKLIDESGK